MNQQERQDLYTVYEGMVEIDKSLIGTDKYMGLAYFWNHEYRHYLRDASRAARIAVHNNFLKAGLSVDGESSKHEKIVERFYKI